MASVDDTVRTLDQIQVSNSVAKGDRLKLIEAAKALVRRLETPTERITYLGLLPFTFAAEKTLIDSRLFQKWNDLGGVEMTVTELAALAKADTVLIERLLRLLAAEQRVDRPLPLTYRMNSYTRLLAREDVEGFHEFCQQVFHSAAHNMPAYLAGLDFQNPTDPNNTSFIQTTDAKKDTHLFPWLMARPKLAKAYGETVTLTAEQAWWVDVYPVEQILPGESSDKDEVTIVDVGGGLGEDLEKFRTQFQTNSGRLVLQDLPHVLEEARAKPPIEKMAYDFFTTQPIIGARIYSLRNVLHDWPLEKATQILRNQIPAMRRGHSKVFIHERIVPDTNIPAELATLDMIMMTLGSAIERTLTQWREVVTGAGMIIVKTWPLKTGGEFVIECDVA